MAMTCLAICGINHQAKVMSVTVAFASGFRIATRFGELVSNESLSKEEDEEEEEEEEEEEAAAAAVDVLFFFPEMCMATGYKAESVRNARQINPQVSRRKRRAVRTMANMLL